MAVCINNIYLTRLNLLRINIKVRKIMTNTVMGLFLEDICIQLSCVKKLGRINYDNKVPVGIYNIIGIMFYLLLH